MQDAFNVLDSIERTSSRLEKEGILRANVNNRSLRGALLYAMNPFWIYGIGSKTFNNNIIGETEFKNVFELLKYLKQNPTGADDDKRKVNIFVNSQPKVYQNWYKRIILKDLRIGITAKTVNKIWGGLIPVFDVMLAKPFDRLFDEVACEVKLDGVRIIVIKEKGNVNMFTRNGKLIKGYNDIINEISSLPIDDVMLDGEIISGDYVGTMNNLFTKTKNKIGIYYIFDIMPLGEFYLGKSKYNYIERKQSLKKLSKIKGDNLDYVFPLTILQSPTIEQLERVTEGAVKQGYEGIMVKNTSALYECKRSINWLKLKPFFSDEFPIIGFENGAGKYKNTLGKVIIDVNGIGVGVGSGFTDVQRDKIWNNQDKYLGKHLEVQYQEKIKKTGSLRFPTVKGFREF